MLRALHLCHVRKYPARKCTEEGRGKKNRKYYSNVDIKSGLNLLSYLTVCLCRVIHLFSIWKYLTLLHLSLLKVIIQFNWVGYYSSCKFSYTIKMA